MANESLEILLDDAMGYITDVTIEISHENDGRFEPVDEVLVGLRKLAITLESALEALEDAD